MEEPKSTRRDGGAQVRLFLCGDVMTGRGIDQILPHPSHPQLHESYVKSATRYVELAREVSGPIPERVDASYVWGDALDILDSRDPHVRVINLETAITRSDDYWKGKGIHYRMSPQNRACLTAPRIDCCVLANNHILDWGYAGLEDSLDALEDVGITTAGAGANRAEAEAPAIIPLPAGGRVLVFGLGSASSGIPLDWAATDGRAGVNLLEGLAEPSVQRVGTAVQRERREGDIVIASIHWGGNWGYSIPDQHRAFAQRLIDAAGVDVIHGHSSHHPCGIEVYHGKAILYGCGDFINDYEGIGGREAFRDELRLMYFVTVDVATGELAGLEMVPTRIARFQINRALPADAAWLKDTMDRECGRFGCRIEADGERGFILRWEQENGD